MSGAIPPLLHMSVYRAHRQLAYLWRSLQVQNCISVLYEVTFYQLNKHTHL